MRSFAAGMGYCLVCGLASAQDLRFQREVATKKAILLEDAVLLFHAVIAGPRADLTTEQAFEGLRQKEIVPEDWRESLKSAANLGEVAYMILKTLDLAGGWKVTVFNSTRAAYKECLRRGLVKAAGPYSRVPGRDLLAILNRLEKYLDRKQSD